MATLTTVVSRIDMIAPSTTTLAIARSLRSRPSSWPPAAGTDSDDMGSLFLLDGENGEQDPVDELLDERVVDRQAADQ